METQVITAPTAGLISLEEAKNYLGVGADDEDTLIEGMILAASNHLCGPAGVLNRSFREWVYEASLPCFPGFGAGIVLPYSPVSAITSFAYTDEDDAEQTLAAEDDYKLKTIYGGIALLVPAGSSSPRVWPADQKDDTDIAIRYTAGDPDNIPKEVEVACKMLVQNMFDHRDTLIRGGPTGFSDNPALQRLIASHDFSIGA